MLKSCEKLKDYPLKNAKKMAGGQGFEPRQAESESAVLPFSQLHLKLQDASQSCSNQTTLTLTVECG